MSLETDKAVFRQSIRAWFANEPLGEFMASDVAADMEKNRATLFAAFPDLRGEIQDLFAEEGMAVARIALNGTHKGQFMQYAPTGKVVQFGAMRMVRLERGVITQTWSQVDLFGLAQQLRTNV